MTPLRVVLVEDHETVRAGLRLLINGQPGMSVVGEADEGHAAVEACRTLRPDVVVMDVSMPGMNGVDATRELRVLCPESRVVALTRHRESGYYQLLLRSGASGYVLKQSRPAELITAIRVAAAGGTYLDPALAGEVGSTHPDLHQRPAKEPLSAREREVLMFIARGHSNKEIAAAFDVSVKTIETHKANAMAKLGVSSRIEIVRYALLQGWLSEN